LADAVAAAVGVGAAGVSDAATRQAIDRAARRSPAGSTGGVGRRPPHIVRGGGRRVAERAGRGRAARLVLEDVARQPVAVVLDDLQWADASLVEVLVAAHRDPWPTPIPLLGLSRNVSRACPPRRCPVSTRVDAFAGRDAPRG
jgi:hypothetical protein